MRLRSSNENGTPHVDQEQNRSRQGNTQAETLSGISASNRGRSIGSTSGRGRGGTYTPNRGQGAGRHDRARPSRSFSTTRGGRNTAGRGNFGRGGNFGQSTTRTDQTVTSTGNISSKDENVSSKTIDTPRSIPTSEPPMEHTIQFIEDESQKKEDTMPTDISQSNTMGRDNLSNLISVFMYDDGLKEQLMIVLNELGIYDDVQFMKFTCEELNL